MNWFKSYKNRSDEALMQLIQSGNSEAFNEVHRRYSKRLLHFMFRMLNNDEALAQDLLQDLFVKLVENPDKFDVTKTFKPWIFTVAANLCRKEYRRPIEEDVTQNSIQMQQRSIDTLIAPVDSQIFKRHLKKELMQLSYEHRTVFILRNQEMMALNEIAEIMSCSVGTVKSRLFYATKKLANRLAEFKPLYQNQ